MKYLKRYDELMSNFNYKLTDIPAIVTWGGGQDAQDFLTILPTSGFHGHGQFF